MLSDDAVIDGGCLLRTEIMFILLRKTSTAGHRTPLSVTATDSVLFLNTLELFKIECRQIQKVYKFLRIDLTASRMDFWSYTIGFSILPKG